MTGSARLYYMAGQEAGYRKAYMHRARLLPSGSGVRRSLVLLARHANHERLRFLKAAQEHNRDIARDK